MPDRAFGGGGGFLVLFCRKKERYLKSISEQLKFIKNDFRITQQSLSRKRDKSYSLIKASKNYTREPFKGRKTRRFDKRETAIGLTTAVEIIFA